MKIKFTPLFYYFLYDRPNQTVIQRCLVTSKLLFTDMPKYKSNCANNKVHCPDQIVCMYNQWVSYITYIQNLEKFVKKFGIVWQVNLDHCTHPKLPKKKHVRNKCITKDKI